MWHIFRNDSESREWFEQWVAYPLQYPGSKLYSAVVLWGAQHGAGKSLIGEVVGGLYGENYYELSPNDLYSDFNDWAANRQFVLANAVASTERRKDADHLKTIITRQTVTINIKYKQKHSVRDCINYFITSNHTDAVLGGRR